MYKIRYLMKLYFQLKLITQFVQFISRHLINYTMDSFESICNVGSSEWNNWLSDDSSARTKLERLGLGVKIWLLTENLPTQKKFFGTKVYVSAVVGLTLQPKNITPFEWTFVYLNNRICKHIIQFLYVPCWKMFYRSIIRKKKHCLFLLYIMK